MCALTEPAETKAVGEALELEHSTIPRGGCVARHHLLEPHGLRMGVVEAMYKLPITVGILQYNPIQSAISRNLIGQIFGTE